MSRLPGSLQLGAPSGDVSSMRPEHPDWKPWWIRRAEFGERAIRLADGEIMRNQGYVWPRSARYAVGWGPLPCPYLPGPCQFLLPHPHSHAHDVFMSDDLAEAEAAFFEAERQLLEAQ